MNEHLELVREQLGEGPVTPQALVLLFRAAEEAEERRDVGGLEEAVELAGRIAAATDGALGEEAERLLSLCEERLERARSAASATETAAAESECPGCGRLLEGSPVRCRACGTLLV